ncbi:MAG: ABC transporter substrate-binding protein [Gemmatimonadaceae bacterium]
MTLRVCSRGRIAAGLALAAALLTGGCEQPAAEFRLGLIGSYDGTMEASSGIPGRRGADLAVEQLNAAGGVLINGRRHRVVLIERRTANRPDAAAVAARALINLDSVDVLIGPQTSNLAVAAAPVAEVSEIPMITPMASNPAVTAGRRMVTRLAFVDAVQGEVLARFAFDSLGVRRAAALHDAASPYGREVTRLFRETLEALGGRLVSIETFDTDDPRDHAPQLRRILQRRPDAILLPSFIVHDSAQIGVARALGFRGRFLGTDAWELQTLSSRDDAVGSIVVANWDRRGDRAALRAFVAAWTARYPGVPPYATAAATYDAVILAAEAASRSGSRSGPALSDTLRRLGAWDGALARYDFRGTGDPIRGAVLLEVHPDSTRLRAHAEPRP